MIKDSANKKAIETAEKLWVAVPRTRLNDEVGQQVGYKMRKVSDLLTKEVYACLAKNAYKYGLFLVSFQTKWKLRVGQFMNLALSDHRWRQQTAAPRHSKTESNVSQQYLAENQ